MIYQFDRSAQPWRVDLDPAGLTHVIWGPPNNAAYALVEDDTGRWTKDGRRVSLVSLHVTGEVRWYVHPWNTEADRLARAFAILPHLSRVGG